MFFLTKYKNRSLYHDIIESLVTALEAKDYYTSGHSERVSDMSYKLAKIMGIRGAKLERIHMAAHLHDIGKIGVPDKILNKKGRLLNYEWEYIKQHPKIGYDILSKSKKLLGISKMVLHHHERWDGKGYPSGLKETDIPEGARIIAVCDTIDAMTSERPYRKALSSEICKKELITNKGIMFEPRIVDFAIEYWGKVVCKQK